MPQVHVLPILTPPISTPRRGSHVTQFPDWRLTTLPDGRVAARVTCWYGHDIDLSGRTVDPEGNLTGGAVTCGVKGCTFKGRIRLQGWPPPEQK